MPHIVTIVLATAVWMAILGFHILMANVSSAHDEIIGHLHALETQLKQIQNSIGMDCGPVDADMEKGNDQAI